MNKTLLRVAVGTVALLSSISGYAFNQCPKLDPSQIEIANYSQQRGDPYDLGMTLKTIAYKESSFGKYTINAVTRDYGIYQGNYKTICKLAGIKPGSVDCGIELKRVLDHKNVAADYSIETLKWWYDYWKKRYGRTATTYQYMIRSYVAGFDIHSKSADLYWHKFKKDFYIIKECNL